MAEPTFRRETIRVFRFLRCGFDAVTGEARLAYAFDDGPELVERIVFPGAPFALDAAREAAVERALRLLHLIAGVSYYKAAVPPEIAIDAYAIDAPTAALLTEIYENGLGEFAYRNGLALRGKIHFPRTHVGAASAATTVFGNVAVAAEAAPTYGGSTSRALVAIGGGKDSLVSIEALRAAGIAQTVAWVGGSQLIAACAERTGLPTLNIQRTLALELFAMNRQGAYNGHIPVTAVNSAILVVAALLHGHDQVVFSNERSASYGSLIITDDGSGTGEVNHQWSKSWAFERALAAHLRTHVDAGRGSGPGQSLRYYSLLRPLSELAVARQFAKSDRYDAHFSSCNRNFHILGERPASRWCGVCPKCHFVFLALAPFMPKPRLVAIFGRNLLDEAVQAPAFDALIEYRDHKPFECVGEGRESRAAFAALADSPAWREDALVERFAREIRPQLAADVLALAPLLVADSEHGVPADVWERVRAHLGA